MPFTKEEKAEIVANFLEIARSDPSYRLITTQEKNPLCGLWLKGSARLSWAPDGGNLYCLAVALDDLGNWSVVTEEGMTLQFLRDEVV